MLIFESVSYGAILILVSLSIWCALDKQCFNKITGLGARFVRRKPKMADSKCLLTLISLLSFFGVLEISDYFALADPLIRRQLHLLWLAYCVVVSVYCYIELLRAAEREKAAVKIIKDLLKKGFGLDQAVDTVNEVISRDFFVVKKGGVVSES